MMVIVAVRRDDDLEIVRTLVLEYLAWVVAQTEKEYGEKIDLDSAFDHAWGVNRQIPCAHGPNSFGETRRRGGGRGYSEGTAARDLRSKAGTCPP